MLLDGKKGLILNVANKNSIAWAIAKAAADQGAQVGVGAQNGRMLKNVEKLIDGDGRFSPFTVDFTSEEDMASLPEKVEATYGKIDFLVHCAAFAPREALSGRFIETTQADFETAMNVSCYSFIDVCKRLENCLNDDASVMTLSYLGSTRLVSEYKVMGVAKAALESATRYLAMDLGVRGIRVNTLSPGPINTLAARGVKNLTEMIASVQDKTPLKRKYDQEEVGQNAVYLMSDLSKGITGQILFIDSGYNILGV